MDHSNIDELLKRFELREGSSDLDRQPRFNVGYKVHELDDGMAIDVALFDGWDVLDCERYWLPSNITTDKAINKWGNARMQQFREEIMEVLL